MLVDNIMKIQSCFPAEKSAELTAYNVGLVEKINAHAHMIVTKVNEMVETRKRVNRITDIREKAIAYHDEVVPFIDGPQSIRQHIDELELIVEDDMWTLPKYRELLFIR